ncbi:MAG: D-alanine--D-alanine ligase [Lachnospiraceae bacterium]|nr:D-alanine--D-alanine ligase [Lachnospiraceae bacterium]
MKKQVAVIFGGQSSEHDVSCVSAANVIEGFDLNRYDIHMIGITKEGHWLYVDSLSKVKDGSWREGDMTAVISPDQRWQGIWKMQEGAVERIPIDVIFPVLHGLYGEDGTIQGLFEMSGIPYVGCGVLASAVSMDKISTKLFADRIGVRQAAYVTDTAEDLSEMERTVREAEAKLGYPMFVKPSNAGSSQGVSKARDREALKKAIVLAKEHDHRVLIEECITGREVECAVLGGGEVKASKVGEILAAAEFYDFDAKYNNAQSQTVIDPDLPAEIKNRIRENAVAIFKAVGGFGLSRVDFFVEKDTNEIVFNEINTLPGFTDISMYPMLWAAMGLDKQKLIDSLIELAYIR